MRLQTTPESVQIDTTLAAFGQSGTIEAEQFQRLRYKIEELRATEDVRVVAVTSAVTRDGKTMVAANLAAALSRNRDARTLLIDADLRRPRQHALFGISSQNGLSAILAGRAGLDSLVEIAGIPDLTVLPAGVVPPNPTELLSRPLFQRLLNALRARYEIILLDTPAASCGGDADTIAARAGGALVVACRDVSSVPALTSLCENLGNFGVSVTGAVLNGAPAHVRRH